MKLLMMSACLPRPSWGASTRNYHLLKALTTRHQVTLVALVNSDESVTTSEVAHLTSITPALRVLSRPLSRAKRWQQLRSLVSAKSYFLNLFLLPEVQETLNALFAKEQYDAILYESALIAGYQAPQNVKIIIDQHNIEYELLERTYELEKGTLRKWYSKQENRLLKKGELDRCRHANLVVVTSERERILLQHSLPTTTIAVVSNGVDVEMFRSDGYTQEKSHQIIFTGTMDYYPNNEAVLFFGIVIHCSCKDDLVALFLCEAIAAKHLNINTVRHNFDCCCRQGMLQQVAFPLTRHQYQIGMAAASKFTLLEKAALLLAVPLAEGAFFQFVSPF